MPGYLGAMKYHVSLEGLSEFLLMKSFFQI
jgi:hypothetical protein